MDLLRTGSANISAVHATGTKESAVTVVAKGYGPRVCDYRPEIVSTLEMVPEIISTEKVD